MDTSNETSDDLYGIIGVSKTASQEEIKKAYKRLALKLHPDKNPGDEKAEERFKKVTEAYNVLSDESLRAKYNKYGTTDVDDGNMQFPHDLNDILKNMFGMNMGHMGNPFGNPFNNTNRAQVVQTIQIPISLSTVLNGGSQKIDYELRILCTSCKGHGAVDICDIIKCLKCNGSGSVTQAFAPFAVMSTTCNSCFGTGQMIKPGKECVVCKASKLIKTQKSIKVEIHKGIQHGACIKLDGKGDYNFDTKSNNDLQLVLVYDIPPGVNIDADLGTVVMGVSITMEELLCGFKKVIEPYGAENKITLISKKYFNPDKDYTFVDKGLPRGENGKRGKLIIRFKVAWPEDETKVNKYHDVFVKIFKLNEPELEYKDDQNIILISS